jgi:hypothetical protein
MAMRGSSAPNDDAAHLSPPMEWNRADIIEESSLDGTLTS